jgi:hypothetical protein
MSTHTIHAFLRIVSRGEQAPRGPDGGYLVPRHFYSSLLETKKEPVPSSPPSKTRIYAIAALDNAALLTGDDMAVRACWTVLLDTLALRVPHELLRSCPLELEASGEATYKAHNGKVISAFEQDQTVFRLSIRTPDTPPLNTRLGTVHVRPERVER